MMYAKGSPLAELLEGTLKKIYSVEMWAGLSVLGVSNAGQYVPLTLSMHG